jgi:hypothetical protein
MKKTFALSMFLSFGLALAPSIHATPIVFSYTTGNLGQGSGANSIVETVMGETVTANAWSVTGNGDTTLQTATLGQYSGLGLGVCNQAELPNCGAPQHEVDDNGQFDFVLFTFSSPVTSVTITIDPVCDCNTDASYYVANGLNPLGKTLAQLGTATTNNETTADTTRTITLTGLGSGVTSILFGASILGNDNYFKIESLSATEATATPEPATFGLAGLVLIGLGVIGRTGRKAAAAK